MSNRSLPKYQSLDDENGKSSGAMNAQKWFARIAAVSILAAFAVAFFWHRNQIDATPELGTSFMVKRSLFQNKIMERGALKAVRSVMIASEIVGNRGKIIRLAPEGSYVKKGQLLVQFDKAPFLEEVEKYKTELERTKAELVQAQEDLKAERAKIEQNLKKGEDDITLTELDLKNLKEGAGPLKIEKARVEMMKHKAEYDKLGRDFEEFQALVKEGYVSQSEVSQIAGKRDDAKSAYEFSKAEYDTLVNFAYPAELEAGKAKVRATKDSFEKMKETAQYTIAGKEAGINRAHANINSAQTRLNIAEDQLRHTEILSPIAGFVIYPETFLGSSSEKRKVQIGDAVFTTQGFMQIPDTAQMLVDTQIREVDIYKVKSGQEAIIRVDAYPDLALKGQVALIGTLAEGREKEGSGGKYFNLQIALKESDPRLRPGMTARVEVVVDQEKDVVMVPVETVFKKGTKTVSYVARDGKVEERAVVIDKSNEDFVVVREGLAEGERVLVLDPTKELNTFRNQPAQNVTQTPAVPPAAPAEEKKEKEKSQKGEAKKGTP
jgi:HlyD family secretion protein